jgi:hypothetical protein
MFTDVGDYVKILASKSNNINSANVKGEFNMMRQMLVEYYTTNKDKAEQLIKLMEQDNSFTKTQTQNMHYQAAVIAVRGYPQPTTNTSTNTYTPPTQENELDKLKRAGWVPLNNGGIRSTHPSE